MKNKIMNNVKNNRVKSFALGLLCVLIIGAYFVSTVNVFAGEEVLAEQDEKPEGMSDAEWKQLSLRAAEESEEVGPEEDEEGQEGRGENGGPEGIPLLREPVLRSPLGVGEGFEGRRKKRQGEQETGGEELIRGELEQELTNPSGLRRQKSGKIDPLVSIDPARSNLYLENPQLSKDPFLKARPKKSEPEEFATPGSITPEDRAYFERHKEDKADAELLTLMAQNKTLFDQQDALETAQHKLGAQIAVLRRNMRDKAEFNSFLNTILLIKDQEGADSVVAEQLQAKIDELTPRLNGQVVMLDMLKKLVEENRRVIAGEQVYDQGLSLYERGADLYARTKESLRAPQRLAAQQYAHLKSGASSIQEKWRTLWMAKAREDRESHSEERRLSTYVELEPGATRALLQEAKQEEAKKQGALTMQVNFVKQMERYNARSFEFLKHENKLMGDKIKDKITILEGAFTNELNKLLGKLKGIYQALSVGAQTKQDLEAELSEQAKNIAAQFATI